MTNDETKRLNDLKSEVYSEVSSIQNRRNIESDFKKPTDSKREGYGTLFIKSFIKLLISFTRETEEKYFKYTDFSRRADEIIERKLIKSELRAVLDEKMLLPIDIAHAITPILYQHSLNYPNYLSLEPRLFAFIAIKISEKGVNNYCATKYNT